MVVKLFIAAGIFLTLAVLLCAGYVIGLWPLP
jgi:hypothetical protein